MSPRTPEQQLRRRWLVLALAVGGAGLFIASWWMPYWSFHLVAPQYPMGLDMQIYLHGIAGDTFEIDILNHYIGMMPITKGAILEASLSPYLISVVALSVLVGLLATGRRLGWLGLVPAVGLPIGFLGDTLYWMYRFGHDLDPHQPINFDPFMPTLLGDGKIGQFHTSAWPDLGFWMALLGALLVGAAVWLRKDVCDHCPKGSTCGPTCNHLILRKVDPTEAA